MTALRDLPLAAAAAALLSLGASAQTLRSQSLDPTPEAGAGLTCTNVGVDVGNRYMRRYDALADCTLPGTAVTGVRFAVDRAEGDPATGLQDVRVRAYAIPAGAPLTFANMNVVAEVSVPVPDGSLQAIDAMFPSPAVVLPGTDFVLEVATVRTGTEGYRYFPGANGLGQTADCYLSAPTCGIDEPMALSAIGFPFVHYLIDAIHEPLFGDPVCESNVNSSGGAAIIRATGSNLLSDNDVTLTCSGLPANTFVFVLASTTFNVSTPGATQGVLCLGGAIGRGVGGTIGSSGPGGVFTVTADLTAIPQPGGAVTATIGENWFLQGWFRDSDGMGGVTSNLTDAIAITVQ